MKFKNSIYLKYLLSLQMYCHFFISLMCSCWIKVSVPLKIEVVQVFVTLDILLLLWLFRIFVTLSHNFNFVSHCDFISCYCDFISHKNWHWVFLFITFISNFISQLPVLFIYLFMFYSEAETNHICFNTHKLSVPCRDYFMFQYQSAARLTIATKINGLTF